MKKNVYLAYNCADTSVAPLAGIEGATSVKDYAEAAVKMLKKCKQTIGEVYTCAEETIIPALPSWTQVWDMKKDTLGNSQATILLVSPEMMDAKVPAKEQALAWDLYFSVHDKNREEGSLPVAIVVLPDEKGSTAYFDADKATNLLKNNLKNGYIYQTNWSMFCSYPDMCIDVAADHKAATSHYDMCYEF